MPPCFTVYASDSEDSGSEETELLPGEDQSWDEAVRLVESGQRVPGTISDMPPRALCGCGRPLHRLAALPTWAACLAFARTKECDRCEDPVLAGELHFVCQKCSGKLVCKDCGPGVYIDRMYDYFNCSTKERKSHPLPTTVMHVRSARARIEGRHTRSALLEDPDKELAVKVVEFADNLAEQTSAEEDLLDCKWQIGTGLLFQMLGASSAEEAAQCLITLANAVRNIVAAQPVLTEASVPCKVYGDTHGQLRDLLLLFHGFGRPGKPDAPNAVFNGDFVDRGAHQLELLALLFSLKILFPTHVWLNRGNHEDSVMNAKYGFQNACLVALGKELGVHVFHAISLTFCHLPLACLVGGKALVLHGGIGDGNWFLNDMKAVTRPLDHSKLQEPQHRWLWNILWSDPIEDDQVGTSVFGVHNSPRSKIAVKFGWNVTQAFCAKNGLDLVIRSHQSKKGGLGFDVMHNEKLVRIFTARDYDQNFNDGAVLHVCEDEEGVLAVRSQVLGSVAKGDPEMTRGKSRKTKKKPAC